MTNEEAMEMLVSVIDRITQAIREIIDENIYDIPPYLWFELCHPKKKPRGSMRRKRQGRESE